MYSVPLSFVCTFIANCCPVSQFRFEQKKANSLFNDNTVCDREEAVKQRRLTNIHQ